MSINKYLRISKRVKKYLKEIVTFLLILIWVFIGYPQIWRNPPIPPEIKQAQAAAGDGRILYAKSTNDGVYQRVFTAPSTLGIESNILSGFTDTISYIL